MADGTAGSKQGKRVLVTGFQPFGGSSENPALAALALIPTEIAGAAISTLEVPVVYADAVPAVWAEIERVRPDAVVLVGQARGRASVTVERVAVNVDDAPHPDNMGDVRRGTPIRAGGPDAYFATLPVARMVEAMRAAGIPAAVSDTAGAYVCNHLMYGVLDRIARAGLPVRAGFVHVPFMHSQVLAEGAYDVPSMSLPDIARALTAGIEAVAAAL